MPSLRMAGSLFVGVVVPVNFGRVLLSRHRIERRTVPMLVYFLVFPRTYDGELFTRRTGSLQLGRSRN